MIIEQCQQGAIGVAIRAECYEDNAVMDLRTATTKEIILRSPVTGTLVTKTAAFVTDGLDGQIQYVTVTGDLSESGQWQAQVRLVLPSGFNGRSDVQQFLVHSNLS